jgi:hypothetical protein
MQNLAPETLLAIIDLLGSRRYLARLCRVSKIFNRIFTPFLYAQLSLEDSKLGHLATVANLSRYKHLRFTKELRFGNRSRRRCGQEFLGQMLEKMPGLVSLEYAMSARNLDTVLTVEI